MKELEKHNEDKWSTELTESGRGRERQKRDLRMGHDCVKEKERRCALGFSVLLKENARKRI